MNDLQPGIGMGDIYRELVEMRAEVARALTGIEVINATRTASEQLHRDHESRLRALETWRWKFAGIMAVFEILIAFLAAYLAEFLATR